MKKLSSMSISSTNKLVRAIWSLVWLMLFRFTPRNFHVWRVFLLRVFGAKLGRRVHVYPSARIWAPWNLEMHDDACLSEFVDCYNVDRITVGEGSTISQYSFLCTASHDYSYKSMPLVTAPIEIGRNVWVTSDVFVAPGVTLGDYCVVTARSSVFRDIPASYIASGNPAVPLKVRNLLS